MGVTSTNHGRLRCPFHFGGRFRQHSRHRGLRQSDNHLDCGFGASDFQDFFIFSNGNGENLLGFANIENSWDLDFDGGLDANDGSWLPAGAFGLRGAKYCNLGTDLEVSIAGSDPGGPSFINGRIATVNSYSLRNGTGFGDAVASLNNTFSEIDGVVPTNIHRSFITSAMALPEPSGWEMLITDFRLLRATARRLGAITA